MESTLRAACAAFFVVALVAVQGAGGQTAAAETDVLTKPRVVVALLDFQGVNAYHPFYHAFGEPEVDLSGFVDATTGKPPRRLELTTDTSWDAAVAHDEDALGWADGELVHFAGTPILGVRFGSSLRSYTGGAHGNGMAAATLGESSHVIIVKPATDLVGDNALRWLEWVVAQPWIDVISLAWNIGLYEDQPNGLPSPFRPAMECFVTGDSMAVQVSRLFLNATRDGKIVVQAAGNGPWTVGAISPIHGPTWIWGVSGSEADGTSKALMSENVWPDYVANYTTSYPLVRTTEPLYGIQTGTSFASPSLAGTTAEILLGLRAAVGHDGGIVDRELAPGYTAQDVRAALNATAILASSPTSPAGVSEAMLPHTTHVPAAEYLTAQWGHVDGRIVDAAVEALLSRDLGVPSDKAAAAAWKEATYAERSAYWGPWERDCG